MAVYAKFLVGVILRHLGVGNSKGLYWERTARYHGTQSCLVYKGLLESWADFGRAFKKRAIYGVTSNLREALLSVSNGASCLSSRVGC